MAGQLYLHIGYPKTGSSAIQVSLAANRAKLAARGVLYPGAGLDHKAIVLALSGDENAALEAERIRAEVFDANADVIIISTEGLATIPPISVRTWLADREARVIVYVREQADSFASGYQQYVKGDLESCSFEEFADRTMVDYNAILSRWALRFGAQNLSVRIYDRGDPRHDDVVADFYSLIGIDDASPFRVDAPDPNPSIFGALLEAKRRLNLIYDRGAAELRELSYQALTDLALLHPEYRGGLTVSPELLERIREKHRASNSVLAREYLGRDVAFEERPLRPGPAFDEAAVVEAWRRLCEREPRLLAWDAAWQGAAHPG